MRPIALCDPSPFQFTEAIQIDDQHQRRNWNIKVRTLAARF